MFLINAIFLEGPLFLAKDLFDVLDSRVLLRLRFQIVETEHSIVIGHIQLTVVIEGLPDNDLFVEEQLVSLLELIHQIGPLQHAEIIVLSLIVHLLCLHQLLELLSEGLV